MTKMNKLPFFSLSSSLVLAASAACGGGGSPPDDMIPCPAGNCGKESFRRALPGKSSVRIDYQRASKRTGPSNLEAIAPGFVELGEQVDEINDIIDIIFTDLETVAGTTPEIELDTEHQWRTPDPDVAGGEVVLQLETINESDFVLVYSIGPAGFEPTAETAILTGEIHVVDGEKADFALELDFDAATAIVPEVGLTGTLQISARPFAGGDTEIWYDFADFGEVGGETEDSITTYWSFDEDSGAIEYLDSLHDSQATQFARWDADAGRVDLHVEWSDPTYGVLDEISTDCWSGDGSETFYGWALIDADLDFFVELDGDEADCEFAPLDGHPDPGAEFDNLPADGEWDDLEASSVPFCEEDPKDPECISYCDLFPEGC